MVDRSCKHEFRDYAKRSVAARLVSLVMIIGFGTVVCAAAPALAWKPYSHERIAADVWREATSHSAVDISSFLNRASAGNSAHDLSNRRDHWYAIDGRVVAALKAWPSYYNAGVIGPDGFPDIAYGQAVIHPLFTGQWMRYIYQQAWLAQSDSHYSADEKGQILAFAYGFLMHGAGDLWAHTLINDFTGGVFPSIKQSILDLGAGKPARILIGLRHLVVESYIGDATPGWDGFDGDDIPDPTQPCVSGTIVLDPPDASCVTDASTSERTSEEFSRVCPPGSPPVLSDPPFQTKCLTLESFGGLVPDVSPDATPGIPLDAPTRFIYNALIDPAAPTPLSKCRASPVPAGCPHGAYALMGNQDAFPIQRGPAIDAILDLKARLQLFAAEQADRAAHNCLVNGISNCKHISVTITVPTVRGDNTYSIGRWSCTTGACIGDPTIGIPAALKRDYVNAWIADIDAGLQHWADLSLAIARGMFDPQTLRDAENDACRTTGPQQIYGSSSIFDPTILRLKCELSVGPIDAIFYAADHLYGSGDPSWINRYLIPMAGLPDFVGDFRHLTQQISDAITGVFQYLGFFNPLGAIVANIKEYFVSVLEGWVEDTFGVDVRSWEVFLTHPAQWFCGTGGDSVTIHGVTLTAPQLFTSADHRRMDDLMGMPPGHHAPTAGLPSSSCGPVNDTSRLDTSKFAPYANTITLSKLILLNGAQLDKAFGETLVDLGELKSPAAVATYHPGPVFRYPFEANVMIDSMHNGIAAGNADTATPDPSDLWLQLIDGDHAWRKDGLPRFCVTNCNPPEMAGYTRRPTLRRQTKDTIDMDASGGAGTFPIWSSCLLRPAFRAIFQDWENDDPTAKRHNFPDLGDPPKPDISISVPPTASIALSGTTRTVDGITYVAGDGRVAARAEDPVFTNAALSIRFRLYRDGAPTPDYGPAMANGTSTGVPTQAGDGPWVFDAVADSSCKTSAPVTQRFSLDTSAPRISIAAPSRTHFTHNETVGLDVKTDDGSGSGTKDIGVTMDGSKPLSPQSTIDALTKLALGSHTIDIVVTDNVGNRATKRLAIRITATSASIQQDVTVFAGRGDIKKATARSLQSTLGTAAKLVRRHHCGAARVVYGAFAAQVHHARAGSISARAATILSTDASFISHHCS